MKTQTKLKQIQQIEKITFKKQLKRIGEHYLLTNFWKFRVVTKWRIVVEDVRPPERAVRNWSMGLRMAPAVSAAAPAAHQLPAPRTRPQQSPFRQQHQSWARNPNARKKKKRN